MTVPKLDSRPFKRLCCSTMKPRQFTGILQLWLTQHFSDPNNITEEGVKSRIWTPDIATSQIQVLPVSDWRPNTTEQRPALLIKRQELKFVRFGIDNRLMGGGPKYTSKRYYSAGLQGSHTVFCISGEGGEAEELAAEVMNELMKFAPIIREWLNMLRVELVGIGELAKLEEASENFVVPVNIAYAFLQGWELLSLDDPALVKITALIQ
jgi:hypothetical protein